MGGLPVSEVESLWDDYVGRALSERERRLSSEFTVSRDDLAAEVTPFGILRWYLHPRLVTRATSALYCFELEIPAGSRSGRLRHPGGIVHFVAQGSGYTTFDDADHRWEKMDLIGIPARPEGVEFQHFNDGPGPARLVLTLPNFDSSLGAGLGAALDVVEPCPEYQESL